MENENTRRGFTQQGYTSASAGILPPWRGKMSTRTEDGASNKSFSPLPQGARKVLRGFTLLELLVVVLIIGILAAIALPQYQKIILKSKFAGMLVSLDTIYKAQRLYYMEHGVYATSLDQLDVSNLNANAACVAQGGTTRTGIYVACTLYVPKRVELSHNIVNVNIDVTNGKKRCYSKKSTNYKGTFLCQELLPQVKGEYLWSEENFGFTEDGFGR